MKLRIEKPIYGGAGLGRVTDADSPLAGKAIFVPFALPDETVDAHITEDKRSFATAELDAVLEPAAERVTPGCEYFGRCGGCHYQHATYAAQVEMKKAILAETLRRAKLQDVPEIAVVFAEPWGYRNRVRLLVKSAPRFSLRYRERHSHASLPVVHCPVAAPRLEEAIARMTAIGEAVGLAALCEEIELFTNAAEDSLLMTLIASQVRPGSDAALKKVCEAIRLELPALRGAGIVQRRSNDDDSDGATFVGAQWGESSLQYAAGFEYRVSLGSFFQVNRLLVEKLAELVTAGRSGSVAWDLYAGVGLFARLLAERFEQVIAVEAAPSANDLRRNLEGTAHRVHRATTLEFLRQETGGRKGRGVRGSATPDLIVVDPPRAGLGSDVCSLLGKIAAPGLVYVSCDPATLSRDLAALIQSGYHLQKMTLVDLFPQTFHMETVAVLSRR